MLAGKEVIENREWKGVANSGEEWRLRVGRRKGYDGCMWEKLGTNSRVLIARFRRGRCGFTLIEVLVSMAIVMMVMTAVVAGVSFSVRNTRLSKDRSLAVRYAQEAVEWLRGWRNREGWQVFTDVIRADGDPRVIYCLGSLPGDLDGFVALANGGCGEGDEIEGTKFSREVEMVVEGGGDRVTVETVVSWDEGGETKQSSLRTVMTKWEN